MKTCKWFHCILALGSTFLTAVPAFSQTPTLGVQLCAGINITGTNSGLYAVQANYNLANSNGWACVGLAQLPATNYFWADTNAVAGQRFYRVVSGPTNLVWIQPGSFTMGSPTNEALRGTDEVQHVVTITKGFYMGKFLVTQSEYQAVVGNNPSHFTGNANLPVDNVSWTNAVYYCAMRTANEQAAGLIPTNWTYRLPTESEWEYAGRAGTVTAFFFGPALYTPMTPPTANFVGTNGYDSTLGNVANPFGVNLQTTTVVGNYQPNGWGLYDMAGNVFEWCQDKYGPYPTGSVTDPQGADSGAQVIRGGAYTAWAVGCRSAQRASAPKTAHSWNDGFRVVLAPK